jgi:hypothetical protein
VNRFTLQTSTTFTADQLIIGLDSCRVIVTAKARDDLHHASAPYRALTFQRKSIPNTSWLFFPEPVKLCMLARTQSPSIRECMGALASVRAIDLSAGYDLLAYLPA